MSDDTLQRIIVLVRDPVFWLVTVAIGLIVSIIANYATRFFDRWFLDFRGRAEGRNKRTAGAYSTVAKYLAAHPSERFNVRLDVLYFNQQQLFFATNAVFFLVVSVLAFGLVERGLPVGLLVVPVAIGGVSLVMVLYAMWHEHRAHRVLRSYLEYSGEKTYRDILATALKDREA